MAQRSLTDRISLAVQDAIYKVADDLTTVVDEALEAFEDAAKVVEEKVTPAYTVVVNGSVDPESLTKHITDLFGGKAQPAPQPETGGGREEAQKTHRERLLREVYKYLSEYRVEGYSAHSQQAEDNTAGVNEKARWVPAYAVQKFLKHIEEEFANDRAPFSY